MCKKLIILAFVLLQYLPASADDTINALLHLPKDIRADSIFQWYKFSVRDHDSAFVLSVLGRMTEISIKENNAIGNAAAVFLKGQYFGTRLHNSDSAVFYMRAAISAAKKENLEMQWADYMFNLGMFYFNSSDKISMSIECLLKANEKFKELDYHKNANAGMYLFNIAYVYYHLNNYRECLNYLLPAYQYPIKNRWFRQQIDNTIGLAYRELGKYDSAFIYFRKTLDLVIPDNDTVWIGIVSGNLGDVYRALKEEDKALVYYKINYKYGKDQFAYGGAGNTVTVLTRMAELYIQKDSVSKAMALLSEAMGRLGRTEKPDYWRQAELFETFASAYAHRGDYSGAYKYSNMAKVVRDSTLLRQNALSYINVQNQIETEKHIALVDKLEAQKQTEKLKTNFLLIGFLLVVMIGGLFYNRYMLKVKKDQEIRDKKEKLLLSEKLRTEEELQYAEGLLEQYLKNLDEKNTLIEKFAEEIARMDAMNDKTATTEQYEQIEQLGNAVLLTDEQWAEFKELFGKVHKWFFIKLKEKIPELTEAELRLLALTKLNVSTKQMAQMLGISVGSVHTARYRLRKKMILPDDNSLEEWLESM